MKFKHNWTNSSRKRRLALELSLILTVSSLVGLASSARSQDSRPRRSVGISPLARQTPTAAPTPRTTQPLSQSAATSIATPTPTPPPTAQPTPYDRIAPQLGEPPPAPVLKPKPTPEPTDQDFDEGSTLKINTDLVTLNVRVIDRNNRPIDNVRQDDFH